VDALTREVQLTFKRLDGEIRAMAAPGPGAREEDAGVRLQVQRQLAQALFKLSVEFRCGRQESSRGPWGSSWVCVWEGYMRRKVQQTCDSILRTAFPTPPLFTNPSCPPSLPQTNTMRNRKEETRFLNKIEAQKGYERGSSMRLVEDEREAAAAGAVAVTTDPGFTQAQLMKVSQAEVLIEERDVEIRKVRRWGWGGQTGLVWACVLCVCVV